MAREVYECVLSGNIAGQFVQTVQHLLIDDPSGAGGPFVNALSLNQELDVQGIIDTWLDCIPVGYNLTSLRTRRVSAGGGPTAIRLAGDMTGGTQGTRAGEISSLQANPISVWIAETDPSKTGRLFWPGVSEDDIADMVLVTGLLSAITNFQDTWIGGVSVLGIGSFKGCIFRRATKTGDQIVHAYVSPLIGTLRKRLHPV